MAELPQQLTTTIPPDDILKINILEKREACLKSIKEYFRAKGAGISIPEYEVDSNVKILFLEIDSALAVDSITSNIFKLIFDSTDIDDKLKAFRLINTWLYKKGMIKFDTEKIKRAY